LRWIDKSPLAFKLEQFAWQITGFWPDTARRRLWLSNPVEPSRNPEHYLAIFCIVRNEDPYIEEWLEFHRMMGVTHFFIYDNGSTDRTGDILSQYQAEGIATVVPWDNFILGWEGVAGATGRMQRLAMLHCLANFGHQAEWIAFIDMDEFLFPVATRSLTELLRSYEDLRSLSVYWTMFGTSGYTRKPEGLVTEKFIQRLRAPHGGSKNLSRVKTIVRPQYVMGVHNSHTFILKEGYPLSWNEHRKPIGFADHRLTNYSNDVIRINHYFSKSLSEFRARQKIPVDRPRQDFRGNDQLLNHIEQDTIEDVTIQRFVPELRRQLEQRKLDNSVASSSVGNIKSISG